MIFKGLTDEQAEENRIKYGKNTLTSIPSEPLMKKLLNGLRDPMIMILLAALAVQFVLFLLGRAEWFEPVGIFIAVLIADGVASVSEYRQEGKADALKKEEEAAEKSKVIRNGRLTELHPSELAVGDIVFLQPGDRIPADGIMKDGLVRVDQSALNGETEEAEKTVCSEEPDIKDLLNRNYVYKGTVVCSGEGYLQIRTVGDRTLFGELALQVQENSRKTPLQIKLGILAGRIACFGYIGAASIIAGILIRNFIAGTLPSGVYGWTGFMLDTITVAVTIVVCAVPEGLPMLTSILLSYQSMKMAKDNVLVRKINGLETAGSISILFSDKTGTITEGRLSVVEFATGNVKRFRRLEDAHDILQAEIISATGTNNSAVSSGSGIIGGNSTDRALMSFLVNSNAADELSREDVKNFDAFDPDKKTSSVTVERDGGPVTYIKGAPEKIIDRCTKYIDENGNIKELTEKNYLVSYIDAQAGRAMRLLAAARADGDSADDALTFVCVLSIRDDVRKEAADAVKEVKNAGIQVVMVTGDRKETAAAIAREAGLITDPGDIVLTSAELAEVSDDELKNILPELRVVARALPSDKSRLVRVAQELDHVVGMTGDGVNDSPALKKADVGFAMGSGTDVAKEAGDITIMDDNFLSIEKAVLYGRTMFRNIREFLSFQLTVNVAAVLTCFLAPVLGVNMVMTVIQLLLVNLAMDTLAAIAFGSEPPDRACMREKPVPRSESIVSGQMLFRILISSGYITFICLAILFIPHISRLFGTADITYLRSALFAVFMMAVIFNGFNARSDGMNPFRGLGGSRSFITVMATLMVIQFVFITFGGSVLGVTGLSPASWVICVLLALPVIPADMAGKAVAHLIYR